MVFLMEKAMAFVIEVTGATRENHAQFCMGTVSYNVGHAVEHVEYGPWCNNCGNEGRGGVVCIVAMVDLVGVEVMR